MKSPVLAFFAISLFTADSVVRQTNVDSAALVSLNVTSGTKTASNVTRSVENKGGNKTSEMLSIYSEGGTIPAKVVPSKPEDNKIVNSTNDLESNLLSINTNVLGSESSARSPIHGRKGVKYPKENFTDTEQTDRKYSTSTAALGLKYEIKSVSSAPARSVSSALAKSVSSTKTLKKIVIETPKSLPKKPTKTISSDDADDEGVLKKSDLPINSSMTASAGRPNLVVPFVITALALPLFATLGYYTLKHGREAWKNRHYRRMDFLLDGMYND